MYSTPDSLTILWSFPVDILLYINLSELSKYYRCRNFQFDFNLTKFTCDPNYLKLFPSEKFKLGLQVKIQS